MKNKIILSALLLSLMVSAFGQTNAVIDSLVLDLKTAKEDTAKVKNLTALSKQYRNISDYENAMKNADSALVLADKINYTKGKANAYNAIGIIYENQGNYPKALKNYFAALSINEEIEYKYGIADSYNNIGGIYKNQGNYPEALENSFSSLKIFEEIGNKNGIANSYNDMAIIYYYQGNYPDALENYFASNKICEEIGFKRGIAITYNNIEKIYEEQGNYPEALESYFASLKIFEEIGDKKYIALSYNNIAGIYDSQGNYPEAHKYLLAALEINKEIGPDASIAATSNNLGALYIHHGNFQDARKYLDEALALSKKIGNKLDIQDSYENLARLDSVEGNFVQSLKHYKMYTIYKDSLLNEDSNNQISRMKIQYETEKKDREIDLLNKNNEIKALQLEQQQVSLLASQLEAEKNQSEIVLMNNAMEIQELKLAETQQDLEHQQAEAEVKAADMELLNKDKELQGQQLEKQKLLRNGMFAGTFLLLLVGLLLFRSFRLRKKLEKQHAIIQERKRISADLHDDIGSSLSEISLLIDLVMQEARTIQAKTAAAKIADNSRHLLDSISEIIWALNSNNDYVENMVAYIRRYAAEYFENAPVKLTITTPDEIPHIPISSENRRNVFCTVKEALHNIIKHAKATEAELRFAVMNDMLSVVISDNGVGMPEGELNRFGNGINNMRNRMTSINGEFSMQNHKGTKVALKLPMG